jgi:hypothetical protein
MVSVLPPVPATVDIIPTAIKKTGTFGKENNLNN